MNITVVSINDKSFGSTISDREYCVRTNNSYIIFKCSVGVDQDSIGRCITQGNVAINRQIALSIDVAIRSGDCELTRVDVEVVGDINSATDIDILRDTNTTSDYQGASRGRCGSCVCCEPEVTSNESSVRASINFIRVGRVLEEPIPASAIPYVSVCIIFIPTKETKSLLTIIVSEFDTTIQIVI